VAEDVRRGHGLPDPRPLTDVDRDGIRRAVRALYRAAGALEPVVVFVPSPRALDAFGRRRHRMRYVGAQARLDWRRRRRPARAVLVGVLIAFALPSLWLLARAWHALAGSDGWSQLRAGALPVLWPLAALATAALLVSVIGRPALERRWGDGALPRPWLSPDDLTGAEPSRVVEPPDAPAGQLLWRLAGAVDPIEGRLDATAALDARWTGGGDDAAQARWPGALRVSTGYRRSQRLLATFAVRRDGAQRLLPVWTTVGKLRWAVREELVVPSDRLRHELAVRAATQQAFAWIAFRYVAVVVEPPVQARAEPLPDGSLRLHSDGQPALVWQDGERDHFLHGVRVPDRLALGHWSVRDIHREPDSRVRRAAIERMGWREYVEQARLQPVARAPDPGNPGAELALYDVPEATARLLVMRNGSPDRSGRVREFAELVPRWLADPVEAAAWQYGCSPRDYRRLQRRT
jgi:hypothetical protein